MRRPLAAIGAALLAGGLLTVATPATAAPTPAPVPVPNPAARAAAALRANPGAVQGGSAESYQVYRTKVDADGSAHVRYTRTYRGLRVHGGDFVIHTAPGGGYAGSSVGLTAPLTLGTTAKVSAATAKKAARAQFTGKVTTVGAPELFVDASSGTGRLAWETVVSGWAADGQTPSRLHVVTDATTGKLIGTYDEIESVSGTGHSLYAGSVSVETTQTGSVYQLIDPAHGNGSTCDMNNGTSTCTAFVDADNTWGSGANANRQSAAIDAHFGAAKTFDYFKNVHGRNGIFGDGRGVPSRVHYGQNYDNAFWDGARMTYGDGYANVSPLVSLDVAAHEMTHGVTDNVVPGGLTYAGESGGLNEASSDIFGTMVEFYANTTADPGDYLIGEKININLDGTPLRYMYDPAQDGWSDRCWSTATKNKDVHFSSGVANHFFFNLAERTGSTAYGFSPICGSAPGMVGIGRDKAAKIWFRALDVYFTSNTSYVNPTNPANTARAYTLRAATDLYGSCSTEYRAVQAAWTAVNVAGNDATCSTGSDFGVTLSPTAGAVDPGGSVATTVATTTTSGSAQPVTLSATGLPSGATASFSPATVTSGGSSTLTITTTAATPPGVYTVRVNGAGSVTRSTSYTLTVRGSGGSCTSPGQQLGNPGFESGVTGWAQTTGVIGQHGTRQPAHSGSWSAWLGGYGSTHADTLTQTVSLPAGCTSYNFSFWLHIDSAETNIGTAYDTLRVQVIGSTGTVLATLATYSNLDRATGYDRKSFSLAPYAGQTVTLKFTGTEDASLQTSFVLDDTAVDVS
ncbi:griselysin. Metallo peptidase. MEROPS family M04 [Micromonospora echinaurantiaca]|uniref:Griselysin. Metallo peptidase. MEROPS family M04 n=1 Tax=Micromonospora echinaurantiaca TaxID=47857 RepID=A0A1C5K3Y1_9ACTN|nr:M4 family metallopeptidase [Micromonospora echinaurantiaca]SCG77493.1 griselysin. Metallo peptidase. MEROPS family M04 [Micromonospora echinaurantiaca]